MTKAFCQQITERKRRCLAEEEASARAETALTADGINLARVTCFKYLGCILTASENDWPAVVSKLQKSRRKWKRLKRVLGRERLDAWTSV